MTSFPVKCPELQDLRDLVDQKHEFVYTKKTPTAFFKEAMELTEKFELVVPVTRNMYIRHKLIQEGVSLVLCL